MREAEADVAELKKEKKNQNREFKSVTPRRAHIDGHY